MFSPHYGSLRPLYRFWSGISLRQFNNYNFLRNFSFLQKKALSMCGKFECNIKLQELILQCLKNIGDVFQVDRMSIREMVGHQKVCRVTLAQSVIHDQKNRCVLRDLQNNFCRSDEFSNFINTFFMYRCQLDVTQKYSGTFLPI